MSSMEPHHHRHHPLVTIQSSTLVMQSQQFSALPTGTIMDNTALLSLKPQTSAVCIGNGTPSYHNSESMGLFHTLEKVHAAKQQVIMNEFLNSHLPASIPVAATAAATNGSLSSTTNGKSPPLDQNVPSLCTDIEPDSTTSSLGQLPVTPEKNCGAKFKPQEDVLVEHKDGRFYLGTVIAIGNCQCLVRFNDNTECWSDFRELTKLSGGGEADDAPACVVCKRQQQSEDSVEVCENCGRGYHVKCMDGNFKRNGYWFCRMCASPNGKRKDVRYVCSGVLSESLDPLTDKAQLPYDIDTLTWDPLHRTNVEQNYCYCGDDGDWLREMIQCCRCQQWYHGRCIRSLQYPIFLGDRFYFFICSICNRGHEFVRRLEVSWPDLIHLALYNLIARNGKRFYDVTKAIFPYVEDNWKTLQMSGQMSKLSPNARKEIITQTLANDRNRFKCGSEARKAATMWTLRVNQPPSPPNVLIQPGQIITEHMLTQMSTENRIYRFLPRVALERSLVNDAPSREKMTGVSYCSPLVSEDDASDVSDDPDQGNQEQDNSSDFEAPTGAGIGGGELVAASTAIGAVDHGVGGAGAIIGNNSTGKQQQQQSSSNLTEALFSSNAKDGFQLFGSGVIAATAAGPSSKPQSDAGSVASGSGNRRAFKSRSKKTESEKSFDIYDSSDDTSRNTLDLIIPPPKDFTGKNNPFHQATAAAVAAATAAAAAASSASTAALVAGPGLMKSGGNELKDLMQKTNTTTNHVSHLSSNLINGELRVARIVKRRLSARDIMNGSKSKRRKFRQSSVIGTTITAIASPASALPTPGQSSSLIASLFSQPLDTNGWTSQIPLSHLLPSSSSSGSNTPANCSYQQPQPPPQSNSNVPQALPASVLTSAASSSASSSSSSATSSATTPTSQEPAAPPPPPSKRNLASHGRRLRQRQERNYNENARRASFTASTTPGSSLPGSPVKNGTTDNNGQVVPAVAAATSATTGSDLQSSLNLYFGAAHRILSGERFVIRGRRVSISGKVQYLIEWEGCPATQVM
ncbi:polycomb protein Pcl-like [Aedes albopictus]|uniref:PHD-type domain-containing protein n=1 Tax=Aedes albopictus TaxID=7160 RepID=A0ABM1YQN9_AEDAL|nr:polycomb protein Pcl isoform X2 [Aedes albopictus]